MLGFAHPNQLLSQLSSSEITEWYAYDKLEPIDSEQWGWAVLCSVVSNIAISIYGKDRKKYTTPEDFLLKGSGLEKHTKESEIQTVEEQKQILLNIAKIQNEKVKKDV